jgi:hypothetical protein
MFAQLRKLLLAIPPEEVAFTKRGFHAGNAAATRHLELIVQTFLRGYSASLENLQHQPLALQLSQVQADLRGFAYEGASMGLAVMDALTPWGGGRLARFIDGPAAPHVYMAHIGAGWAFARLRFARQSFRAFLPRLDPLLRYLAVDGYGFHEGYFRWRQYSQFRSRPPGLIGEELRVFDQGLGRSLWFVAGGDVGAAARAIATFAIDREPDLWSGVGLACTYAGGVDGTALRTLLTASGRHRPHLCQGVCFAAAARVRAGNVTPHTEEACSILCNLSAEGAAHLTDDARRDLSPSGGPKAYGRWRCRICEFFLARS